MLQYGDLDGDDVERSGRVRIEYEDEDLRLLAEDETHASVRFGRDLVRAYRKKIGIIAAARDERDLRAFRSLHLEQLKGRRSGQSSIRLNGQFRMILRFCTDGERVTVVIDVTDYH